MTFGYSSGLGIVQAIVQVTNIRGSSVYTNYSNGAYAINTTSSLSIGGQIYYIAAFDRNNRFHAYVIYNINNNMLAQILIFYGDNYIA